MTTTSTPGPGNPKLKPAIRGASRGLTSACDQRSSGVSLMGGHPPCTSVNVHERFQGWGLEAPMQAFNATLYSLCVGGISPILHLTKSTKCPGYFVWPSQTHAQPHKAVKAKVQPIFRQSTTRIPSHVARTRLSKVDTESATWQ